MCGFNKKRIKELEFEIKVLEGIIENGMHLILKDANSMHQRLNNVINNNMTLQSLKSSKKCEVEYFLFTKEAKRLLHYTNTNCDPFRIIKRDGKVVTTSNGDTISTDWIYCINNDNPKYTPTPIGCKCCHCCCK